MTAWWFEDYEAAGIGHRWTSAERRVSAQDISCFAELTGDTHPQHVDPGYGAASAYGAQIAHGFLTTSLASGLVYRMGLDKGTSHAILGMSWRLPAPVYADDILHVVLTLTGCRASAKYPALGIIERRYEVFRQDDTIVAVGDLALLCKRRFVSLV